MITRRIRHRVGICQKQGEQFKLHATLPGVQRMNIWENFIQDFLDRLRGKVVCTKQDRVLQILLQGSGSLEDYLVCKLKFYIPRKLTESNGTNLPSMSACANRFSLVRTKGAIQLINRRARVGNFSSTADSN